ncbi:hypothetical protein D7319_25280 [Streptomyces radicis]|uniref:Sensor domain-containing protein n=1 Tax=Streptomyces radicis TaxID=1750517 RepID=A0A3A9VWU2_9ACTN|nr:hypothetical protein D7319_25280 [Streptomyces radicis]RKN16916.1 hypothetical protein D7318_24645 [Streptomyces radicis]
MVAGSLTAVCLLAVASAPTARAAAEPVGDEAFLDGGEMPPHPDGWYAYGPVEGLPEYPVFCFEDELPAEGASHTSFWTELDTNGLQVIVETDDEDEAAELATALEAAAADCAADWLRENPGSTAAWDDYGSIVAADGGHIYGVHTAPPQGGHGVRLFGVGRDGTRVTLVDWGQMGDLEDAPIGDFSTTLAAALGKLGA